MNSGETVDRINEGQEGGAEEHRILFALSSQYQAGAWRESAEHKRLH
jgi:hypothetical protein